MEGEEWELCNDDGFIFKRRKGRQPEEVPQETPAEPEGEPRRNQLARRKISLLAVRERYRKEIEKLEGLAVSLLEDGRFCGAKDGGGGGDFGVTGEESTLERGAVGSISSYCNQKEGEDIAEPGNPFRALIEELMLQVEAQEAILKKLSNLCDIADSVCDMREEAMMESLLDLPVWESPRALMASLVD